MRIRLPVIEKPQGGEGSVLTHGEAPASNQEPLMVGDGKGDTDLICGSCGLLLAEGIVQGQIADVTLHCPRCGTYNHIA
jgi:hypothetical protein